MTDLRMTGNVREVFKILIWIVSFDIYAPFDYFDVGFTETTPWSHNFEWIGYESRNFLDLLGGIIIFAFTQTLFVLVVATAIVSNLRNLCKRGKDIYSWDRIWISSHIF